MALYDIIFNFFYESIFAYGGGDYDYDLASITHQVGYFGQNHEPLYISLQEWLCHTCTIIALGFILVLCCKFIYKVIRIVGGLVSR